MQLAKTLLCAAALAAWAALVAGCGDMARDDSSSPMPASAADAQSVQNIRDKYHRAYPESRVGIVIATLKNEPLVAIGELPAPAELRENERVTFLDGRARVLTTGTVVRVLPDQVHVRYDAPPRGGRKPRRGDVAVVRLPANAPIL